MVRLPAFEAEAECGRLCFEPRMNVVQRVVAVNLGLARAEQVEIGAGEDKDGRKFSQGTAFRLRRCGLPLYGLLDKRQSEADFRSEEHTSALQSLMRISYAVFCLKQQLENT